MGKPVKLNGRLTAYPLERGHRVRLPHNCSFIVGGYDAKYGLFALPHLETASDLVLLFFVKSGQSQDDADPGEVWTAFVFDHVATNGRVQAVASDEEVSGEGLSVRKVSRYGVVYLLDALETRVEPDVDPPLFGQRAKAHA